MRGVDVVRGGSLSEASGAAVVLKKLVTESRVHDLLTACPQRG